MKQIEPLFLEGNYSKIKESEISGRWVTLQDIKPLYANLAGSIQTKIIGQSEEGRDIYQLKLGSGKRKILVWSQMHGNESTGTKAVFDFLNFTKYFSDSKIM